MNLLELRTAVTNHLDQMRAARDGVRTYWGECTVDAMPLMRLDKKSNRDLISASLQLTSAVLQPLAKRRKDVPTAFEAVQSAWRESCQAIGEWDCVHTLAKGDEALEDLKRACSSLVEGRM